MSLPDVHVVCETFGILVPRILWFIDKQNVTDNITTLAGNSSDIDLQMWHIAATGKLRVNESFAFNVSTNSDVWCAHEKSDGTLISSDAVKSKPS